MCIKNRVFALVFRLIMLIGCSVGLYSMLFMGGKFNYSMLVFYTNLSNLVCWVFFLVLTIKTISDIKSNGVRGTTVFLPKIKGMVTMMITVTFLVFAVLLAPLMFQMGGNAAESVGLYSLANILVHYFTPLMVIFDWLLFDEKNRYRWFEPFRWLIIPYLYFIFALIRAEIGGELFGGSRYPYFFIDVDKLGWGGVALYVLGITVFFIIIGYLLVAIDHLTIENRKLKFNRRKDRL